MTFPVSLVAATFTPNTVKPVEEAAVPHGHLPEEGQVEAAALDALRGSEMLAKDPHDPSHKCACANGGVARQRHESTTNRRRCFTTIFVFHYSWFYLSFILFLLF